MINQQLLDFINGQLKLGLTKEKITSDLLANGWNAQDVEEGFRSLVTPNIPAPVQPSATQPATINLNNTPKSSTHFFSYKGRIGRQRYLINSMIIGIVLWIFNIIFSFLAFPIIVSRVVGEPALALSGKMSYFSILSLTLLTVFLIVILVVAVEYLILSLVVSKRFHDLNKSGWHCLALLVPFYNVYLTIGLIFQRGTDGPNNYGDDPLPPGTNHGGYFDKFGRSVTFKLIITLLSLALIILGFVSSTLSPNADYEKQYNQQVNKTLENALLPGSANTTQQAQPEKIAPTTITSSSVSGWKSKEVYNASNPSVCYTIKYPPNFPPRKSIVPGDMFLLFVNSSVQAGVVPPDADIIDVAVSPYTSILAESKMSGSSFYNYFSKELHPNVAINTFSTDSGLKAEEFIDNSKNGPTSGMWIIYVEVPKKDGKTNIIVIKNSVTLTYNLSISLQMAKTITASCGH